MLQIVLPDDKWIWFYINPEEGDIVQLCYSSRIKDAYIFLKATDIFENKKNFICNICISF